MDKPELVISPAGKPNRPPPPSPQDIQPLFPHLEIIRLLGRGGMGAVYEARQRGLKRTVALKLLWAPQIPDAAFEERFAREGRALAQLTHDNIVTVHDAGKAGPYYWLVMEYVDGPNLRQLVQEGPIEPSRAMAIVMQMCAALDYAHRAGVVHRDVKPENVLLTSAGNVKIADFGLAKLLDRDPQDITLTRSEQAMGTPHYMAPEQVESSKYVDHRADIYSLGVVLYEVLTGELPLGRFLLPSRRADVDSRLDEIVAKAMQTEPDRRYQAASDVHLAVGDVAAGRFHMKPSARHTTTSRQPVWIALAAFFLLGLGSWFLISRTETSQAKASIPALTAEEHFAEGRDLVVKPDRVLDGIAHLESAYAMNPELPQLREFLSGHMRQGVALLQNSGRLSEAMMMAQRLQDLAPSSDVNELVTACTDANRREFEKFIVVTSPAPGEVLATNDVVLQGKFIRTPFDGTLTIDSSAVDTSTNTFARSLGRFDDGRHAVKLLVRRESSPLMSLPVEFTIDTKKPNLTIRDPLGNGSLVRGDFIIQGRIADDTISTLRVADRKVPYDSDGNWTCPMSLAAGPHDIVVVATDAAGNPNSQTVSVVVDTQEPVINDLGHGFQLVERSDPYTISMKVTDDHQLQVDDHQRQYVLWDGQPILVGRTGEFQISIRPESTETRPRTFHELKAIDKAGNYTIQKITSERDRTPPNVDVTLGRDYAIAGIPYVLQGTYKDQTQCYLELDGEAPTALSRNEIHAEVPVPATQTIGKPFVISFVVKDEAGNPTRSQKEVIVYAACEMCRGTSNCLKCSGTGVCTDRCKNASCKGGLIQGKCPSCSGQGKALCDSCGGSGHGPDVQCSSCRGTGQKICPHCAGKGEFPVKCARCGGSGQLEFGRRRCDNPKCHGGYVDPQKCDFCSGAKNVKCRDCEGGLKQTWCKDCDKGRSRTKLCPSCNGSKKSDPSSCPDCDGGKRLGTHGCTDCAGRGICGTCNGTGRKP